MRGGLQDDTHEINQSSDSSGIIPVTARILKKAIVNDTNAEYKGVKLRDIVIVGNLIEVEEKETRVIVKIWDHTQVAKVTFFNRNELESLNDLIKLAQDNIKKPVQIYATIKIYKNNIGLNGAKLLPVTDNEFTHHTMDLVCSWLNLTGRMCEASEDNMETNYDELKNFSNKRNNFNNNYNNNHNHNSFNNNYQSSNVYQFNHGGNQFQQTGVGMRNNNNNFYSNMNNEENMILNAVKELNNKNQNGGCRKHQLIDYLRNNKSNIRDFDGNLDSLMNNGYLIEEDDVIRPTGN